MSLSHTHHPFPHPSPTPQAGSAQAWLVPPLDNDDPGANMPLDFTVFPVASIPSAAVQLHMESRVRVVIADAQSKLGVYGVRGFLKHVRNALPVHVVVADDDDTIQVFAMVQDTESPEAREIKALGATLLQYDPTSPASIRSALGQSGSPTLLLIPSQTDDAVIRTSAILTEARHSIKSIVMWSSIGTDNAMDLPPEDDFDPTTDDPAKPRLPSALLLLKEAEELVKHVEGMDYVVMRAGFPLQHFFLLSALIQNRGSIPFTSETEQMAPISLSDMGHATAALLHRSNDGVLPDDYKNKVLLLTGPDSLSGPMIVTAANERLPHPLSFAKVGISDMRSFLLQTRASRFELSLAMGWWRLFMDGKLNTATGDLADLVGGPERVTKIRDFFERHVDRFLPAVTLDGEQGAVAPAAFAHDTYDDWDALKSTTPPRSSPSKIAAMVVHDCQSNVSPRRRRAGKTLAAKCITDTRHQGHAPQSHKPSKPLFQVLDEAAARVTGITTAFHLGVAHVLQSTVQQLHAVQASLRDAELDGMAAEVQVLLDRMTFMADVVDACARDVHKTLERPAMTAQQPAKDDGSRMVDRALVEMGQGSNLEGRVRTPSLVKKIVGDTVRGATGDANQGGSKDEEAIASKVDVFAKVMHDVAPPEEKEQQQQQQRQGSCSIQ